MFLKCLILILNFFYIVNCFININNTSSNYCALEKYCAHNRKHVGCSESKFNYTSPYQLQHMTKEYRELILNEINQFRDDIALGKIHSDVFNETVSNMRMIRWNHEFETLTELMILKIHDKEFGCIATNMSQDPRQMRFTNHYPVTQDTNVVELNKRFLSDSLRRYINSAVIELKSNKTKMLEKSGIYNARTSTIGCAFAQLVTDQQSIRYTLRCAYYARNIDAVHKAVLYGKPCSKCNIFYEKCDELYPGLCVPLLKREINFHYVGTNDSLPRISIINNENDKQESSQIVRARYMSDKFRRGAKDYNGKYVGKYKIQPPQQLIMQTEQMMPKQEIICYNCTIQMYFNSNSNGNGTISDIDNLLK